MSRLNASNFGFSTLSAAITITDTDILVEDASEFPAPPFRAVIREDDIVEVVEVIFVLGNLLQCIDLVNRGLEDTSIAAFNEGAFIENTFTAGCHTELAYIGHGHGNISNTGEIGTVEGLPLITGTGGLLQTGEFGTASGMFCEGDDARLSNNVRTNTRNIISVASSTTDALLALDATTNAGIDATLLSGSIASNAANRYFMRFFGTGDSLNFAVSTNGTLQVGDIPVARISGTLGVSNGGTGMASYTAGRYLRAAGTTSLETRTPAQVLADIGAAAATHSHSEIDGLKSHATNTGSTSNTHRRVVIASEGSEASGNRSAVIASEDSEASGIRSAVINSNLCWASGSDSLILNATRVRSSVVGSTAGGWNTTGDILTSNRKWTLDGGTGNIATAGSLSEGASFSDYGEFFPNITGEEIPPGTPLVIDIGGEEGFGVRPVREGEFIEGIVSETAGIRLNDTPFTWSKRYLTDEWGKQITEEYDVETEEVVREDDETRIPSERRIRLPVENPEFDPGRENIPRSERKSEWTLMGIVGQMYIRVEKGVKPGDHLIGGDSIAVKSDRPTNIKLLKILQEKKEYNIGYCFRG